MTRVKTLVSMTTPRDFRSLGSSTLPPFVEFDMSAEGFGCLYLPSVAPQSPNGPAPPLGGSIDNNVISGIGSGILVVFRISHLIISISDSITN